MRKRFQLVVASAIVACALTSGAAVSQAAVDFTFTTPDGLVGTANGLNGQLWSGSDIAPVDTLSAARTHIQNNAPESLFMSSVVDYPNGAAGSIGTTSDFNAALGVDASSLTNAGIGTTAVLNSILKLDGYLKIDAANANKSLFLGLGSDDGSELLIQGTQVIANDGVHAFPGSGSGPKEIVFTTPGLYEMSILFFESQRVQWGLEFFLGSPGQGTPVPNSMLVKDVAPVPEPTTLTIWGCLGMLGVAIAGRRRRRSR
jgi:hypothetical protein